MNLSNRLLLVLFVFILIACKSKKQKTEDASKPVITLDKKASSVKDVASEFINAKNRADYLFFNAEAQYKDEKINQTINLEVQVSYNNYIWLNAKVLFVNVARMLITPDSVRIIDYLNRQYISASYSYLNKYSSVPLRFEQLQNLVYGNILFEPNNHKIMLDSSASELLMIFLMEKSVQQSLHNKNNLKPNMVKLKDEEMSRNFEVNYSNFKDDGNNMWPQKIVINIQAEKKVDCNFSISNLATSKIKEPQFAVPKTYKVLVYQ
ncbi:MAG: DUF4292 domain-containing protein [Bacteroidia bacterium]